MAAVLLLCFSVAVLPLDLLHNHGAFRSPATSCKNASGQTCSHKYHLTTRTSFCWACAIHLEKIFDKGSDKTLYRETDYQAFKGQLSPLLSKSNSPLFGLRGPPRV
ncbi:MAG: hypothetical protein ACKOWL_01095 [Sphingobacteriaceae bacterium]